MRLSLNLTSDRAQPLRAGDLSLERLGTRPAQIRGTSTNRGAGPVRILNVRLGNYQTELGSVRRRSRDSLSTSSRRFLCRFSPPLWLGDGTRGNGPACASTRAAKLSSRRNVPYAWRLCMASRPAQKARKSLSHSLAGADAPRQCVGHDRPYAIFRRLLAGSRAARNPYDAEGIVFAR